MSQNNSLKKINDKNTTTLSSKSKLLQRGLQDTKALSTIKDLYQELESKIDSQMYQECIITAEEIFKINPNHLFTLWYYNLALCKIEKNEESDWESEELALEAEISYYWRISDLRNKIYRIINNGLNIKQYQISQRIFDNCLNDISDILFLYHPYSDLYSLRGTIYFKMQQYKEAIEDFLMVEAKENCRSHFSHILVCIYLMQSEGIDISSYIEKAKILIDPGHIFSIDEFWYVFYRCTEIFEDKDIIGSLSQSNFILRLACGGDIFHDVENLLVALIYENYTHEFESIGRKDGDFAEINTGFTRLDNAIGGLYPGSLIILASRPLVGKTSLALEITKNVAMTSGNAAIFFSLEMSKEEVVDRLISSEAKVDLFKIKVGKLHPKDFDQLPPALDILSKSKLFIEDSSENSVIKMREELKRIISEGDELGLVVVDYLQLMESSVKNDNILQQVSEISRSLKMLALEFNIPILALSQLPRSVEYRLPTIPRLEDLTFSGLIDKYADVVLFIYREERDDPDTENKGIAEIHIAKQPNGVIGKIRLGFKKEYATFINLPDDSR